jgi:hypothetical protein
MLAATDRVSPRTSHGFGSVINTRSTVSLAMSRKAAEAAGARRGSAQARYAAPEHFARPRLLNLVVRE